VSRTVYPVADTDVFKALYYDRENATLRPNLVFVDPDGSIVFETNEVGLKGDPLDPSRKLAVVWGDSVVFGSGRGWACLLDRLAPGYQFLNGGLDGDPFSNILRRASEFNRRHPVALNLLMLGWHHFVPARSEWRPAKRRWLRRREATRVEIRHPHCGNENLDVELTRFLEATPATVVLTMPTALNRRIIDEDLSAYLVPGEDKTGFRFIGDIRYQIDGQRQGFEAHRRTQCDSSGRVQPARCARRRSVRRLRHREFGRFPRAFLRCAAFPAAFVPAGRRVHLREHQRPADVNGVEACRTGG
jgi:hypothetical protein